MLKGSRSVFQVVPIVCLRGSSQRVSGNPRGTISSRGCPQQISRASVRRFRMMVIKPPRTGFQKESHQIWNPETVSREMMEAGHRKYEGIRGKEVDFF